MKFTYFSSKKDFSTAFLAAVIAAFFGKLIKFKKSTCETTFASIDPFKLLSVATRRQRKYALISH